MASSGDEIPMINLRSPNAPSELFQAASNNGFIFIEHDSLELESAEVQGMFDILIDFAKSRDLFAAPREQKAEYAINSAKSGKNHGWLGPGTETLDPSKQKKPDQKEAFNIGALDPGTHISKSDQPLPEALEFHRKDLGTFMQKCHALCNTILTLLAAGLDMPDKHWFEDRHNYAHGNSSILRLLYYPALENGTIVDKEDIRAGAHSDYGSVTLLFRLPGQPGLEILTKKGTWAAVPVDPKPAANGTSGNASSAKLPILVNIGDVLSYWTNGLFKSTVHRVVFPGEGSGNERYSIAYFCHPDDDAELVGIPSPVVKNAASSTVGVQPMEGVRTAKDHLNARLAATYGI